MSKLSRRPLPWACLLLLAAALSSCATRQGAIRDLREVADGIRLNGSSYTLQDWKNAAADYGKANKRLVRHAGKYTPQEQREIADLTRQCVVGLTTGGVQDATHILETVVGTVKGIVEDVKEGLK